MNKRIQSFLLIACLVVFVYFNFSHLAFWAVAAIAIIGITRVLIHMGLLKDVYGFANKYPLYFLLIGYLCGLFYLILIMAKSTSVQYSENQYLTLSIPLAVFIVVDMQSVLKSIVYKAS